ncbi:MAG: universal stress protein [Firmicutes bacterium]|nr:universal stress protein [Bacillota bacterium]
MFNKVLLAVDGSTAATNAIHLVRQMLDTGTAKNVTVLYVGAYVKEVNSYYALAGTTRRNEIREELRQAGQKILDAAKEILGSKENVNYVIDFGNQAEQILEWSKKGYDLVVVGSRGLNPFADILIGSVSNRVIQFASCPVLVVKP